MNRHIGMLAATTGFLGVLLGAFGAHGLKSFVEPLADAADRMRWWETGARYHLVHALALGLVAIVAHHVPRLLPKVSAGLFVAGIAIFSGSLYAMAISGVRGLGALTPLGGLFQLGGWLALLWAMRGLPEKS